MSYCWLLLYTAHDVEYHEESAAALMSNAVSHTWSWQVISLLSLYKIADLLRFCYIKKSSSSVCNGPSPAKLTAHLILTGRNLLDQGIFVAGREGVIRDSILLLCSTSGPLLPLPHPELKSVNLLNYFKKCTACPLRHRKLHLMVYCIRIAIFREKSTDTISDFLFPILLIFASSCFA